MGGNASGIIGCFSWPVPEPGGLFYRFLSRQNNFQALTDKSLAVPCAAGHAAVPELLRTHPLAQERVKSVRAALPSAHSTLENSGCTPVLDAFHMAGNALRRQLW